MLNRIVAFCRGDVPEEDPVSRFANSGWSKATTPDEIIVAHILKKIAEDLTGWTSTGTFEAPPKIEKKPRTANHYDYTDRSFTLSHVKNRLYVKGSYRFRRYSYVTRDEWKYPVCEVEFLSLVVNNTPLDPTLSPRIAAAYTALNAARKKVEEAAARALRELEENEKKWDLAETLLNMKRNEYGALVPATAEVTDAPDEDEDYIETPAEAASRIGPKPCGRKIPNTCKVLSTEDIFDPSCHYDA